MEKIVIELSAEEKAALQILTKKYKCSAIEEAATKIVLLDLVRTGLITESAERNGWKIARLDE